MKLSFIKFKYNINTINNISIDKLFIILFFIFGPLPILSLIVQNNYYTSFYLFFTPESIAWACGQGFKFPISPVIEIAKFSQDPNFIFDCSFLYEVNFYDHAGFFSKVQPYLTWLTAFCWRLFGISYASLIPILYVLYALYISGVYFLSRQFLNNSSSFLIAIFIAISPISAYMGVELRDFSKAPFFIWALIFLIKSVSEENHRKSIIYVVMSAIVIALGYGFRSDLILMVPIGCIFLFFFGLINYFRSNEKEIIKPLFTISIFIIIFVLAASPIWSKINIGGYSGTFLMQGMSEPFRIQGNITNTNYANGWSYSDELTLSSVAAVLSEKDSTWDKVESSKIGGIDLSNAIQKSTSYTLGWIDIFIGDFFTQAIKSFAWIINFPNLTSRSIPLPRPGWQKIIGDIFLFKISSSIYSALSNSWYFYVGLIGFFSLILITYLKSPAQAISFLILLIILLSYPATQFDLRHMFHLEFLWLLCLFAIFNVIPLVFENLKKLNSLALIFTAVLVSTCLLYFLAITYQKNTLTLEISKLLALPRINLQTHAEKLKNGDIFLKISLPQEYEKIVFEKFDSMTPTMYLTGGQWDVRAKADRLLIHISGVDCDAKNISLYSKYHHTAKTWQPLDMKMNFTDYQPGMDASILIPVFYRATQYFEGIVIPSEFSRCNISVEKIIGENRLPVFFTANLNGDKIIGLLYKTFGSFKNELNTFTISEFKEYK
ncbi:glycosyltransferase family 39 protein [Zwartia sp.]|uniref:glycosyltransferase family 39 protein n=1 Tax=Zwartia sp. TaxID=2978004 RepID=UPI00271FEC54|nr:glycosyltransferase family 39 protein [Zwartia sp.]MDO9022991.1 glycosyltransferase family 39 protein [Zwartia sp.]